ncbi:hypothetical protein SDC9_201260 [bioreactor metagenome]|uniref:Uncharacterized protein n=1 Tax=bioreactor metagenome TaxID=1076179 RepID=A0A645IR70_9ZZZZ
MNNAFGDSFVNDTACFGQEGFSIVGLTGINSFQNLTGNASDSCFNREIAGASFSISFYTADR